MLINYFSDQTFFTLFLLEKDKPLPGLRGLGGAHDGAEPHTVLRKLFF